MMVRLLLVAALSAALGLVVSGPDDDPRSTAPAVYPVADWVLAPRREQIRAADDDGVLDWYREKRECPRFICEAFPCCQTSGTVQMAGLLTTGESVCEGESDFARAVAD
ncbi:MAG: hypothetical protein RQ751_12080 [Longimicrobiales bacterium]|nr:hypothetical protein [Longimicrobiales bacterium]